MHKTYINSILMIIFKVFIVIESGFIFAVIKVHQFSPVQVEAIKQLLVLSPSQERVLCVLAFTSLKSDAGYSVYSRVYVLLNLTFNHFCTSSMSVSQLFKLTPSY